MSIPKHVPSLQLSNILDNRQHAQFLGMSLSQITRHLRFATPALSPTIIKMDFNTIITFAKQPWGEEKETLRIRTDFSAHPRLPSLSAFPVAAIQKRAPRDGAEGQQSAGVLSTQYTKHHEHLLMDLVQMKSIGLEENPRPCISCAAISTFNSGITCTGGTSCDNCVSLNKPCLSPPTHVNTCSLPCTGVLLAMSSWRT